MTYIVLISHIMQCLPTPLSAFILFQLKPCIFILHDLNINQQTHTFVQALTVWWNVASNDVDCHVTEKCIISYSSLFIQDIICKVTWFLWKDIWCRFFLVVISIQYCQLYPKHGKSDKNILSWRGQVCFL